MKKGITEKITVIMLTLALTFGPCTMAFATDATNANATRNTLKSQGNIVYTDGENSVGIYSDDLYTIADQLDSYKTSIADQLEKIHTYFTSDTDTGTGTTTDSKVSVTHAAPSSTDMVDPLVMDFDTLLEGLATSQSIPMDVTEYGYPAGTNLYKTENGTLTTDSKDATQIAISAATAENLSAGTAAWVNGNLILGTGADNTVYYEEAIINLSASYVGQSSGSGIILEENTIYAFVYNLWGSAPTYCDLGNYITGNYQVLVNTRTGSHIYTSTGKNKTSYTIGDYEYIIKTETKCTIQYTGKGGCFVFCIGN